MKKPLMLILSCLSLCCAAAINTEPIDQNDLTFFNLKGKIKLFTDFKYHAFKAGNNIDSNYSTKTQIMFNLKGRSISFAESGSSLKYPFQKPSGILTVYDDQGREIQALDITSKKVISTSVYSRDKDNNLVEVTSFGLHDNIISVHDKYGLFDSVYTLIGVKKKISVICYYNKNSDLIEKLNYLDRRFYYRELNIYDTHRYKIENRYYDDSAKIANKAYYTYDNLGNMLMEIDSSRTFIGGNRIFTSNPKNKDISIFKCRYSNFDKHNNWQRQDVFYKDSIAKTIIRKIEYYPEN